MASMMDYSAACWQCVCFYVVFHEQGLLGCKSIGFGPATTAEIIYMPVITYQITHILTNIITIAALQIIKRQI